jgi:hypothetical protein
MQQKILQDKYFNPHTLDVRKWSYILEDTPISKEDVMNSNAVIDAFEAFKLVVDAYEYERLQNPVQSLQIMLADAFIISKGFNIPEVTDQLQDLWREIENILEYMRANPRVWTAVRRHHDIPGKVMKLLGERLGRMRASRPRPN